MSENNKENVAVKNETSTDEKVPNIKIEKSEIKDLTVQNKETQVTEQNKDNEKKAKEWNETKLLTFIIGISLLIEGVLIYNQAGSSQFYVALVTAFGGLIMAMIAYFNDFDDDEEENEEEEKTESSNEKVETNNEQKPIETNVSVSEKTEQKAAEENVEDKKEPEESWFTRLTKGLTKTRTGFIGKLKKLVLGKTKIDDDLLDELEEALYEADIGVKTTEELLDNLRKKVEEEEIKDPNVIYASLKEDLRNRLNKYIQPPVLNPNGLTLYMIIGVNGVGKTTTIAKLANHFKSSGKKVVLAAGDTFRAAAIDQLCIWGERIGVDVIHGNEGGDPGALVFDAIVAAKKRNADILIVDTAGRMHNKTNLMAELQKVKKIAAKESIDGPHEIMLVLDATTGQNAVQQAKQFNESIPITGIVVTKLDGTAKGGVLFAVEEEVSAPVKFIGVGEKMNDLMPFNPDEYLEALFADDSEKKKESDYNVVK